MKLPIFRTVGECFASTIATFRALPLHFVLLFVLLFAIDLGIDALQRSMSDYSAAARDLARELLGLLLTLALVPFSIAMHRFALLGERMMLAGPYQDSGRLLRYSALSIGLTLFFLVPAVVQWLGAGQGAAGLVAFAAVIFGLVLLFACMPWFAAIAVDDPSASFSISVQSTRGNRWRLLAITILILLTMAIPLAAAIGVRFADAGDAFVATQLTLLGVVSHALSALVLAVLTALFVALANVSYRTLWPKTV